MGILARIGLNLRNHSTFTKFTVSKIVDPPVFLKAGRIFKDYFSENFRTFVDFLLKRFK